MLNYEREHLETFIYFLKKYEDYYIIILYDNIYKKRIISIIEVIKIIINKFCL